MDSERRFESCLAIHGEGLPELLAGEGYGQEAACCGGHSGRHWAPSVPARVKRITVSTSLSSSAALGGAARAWASSLS